MHIYSDAAHREVCDSPLFLSFHYAEDADEPYVDLDEQNFVLAFLKNETATWLANAGKNDIYANTIDINIAPDTSSIFGLFKATNRSPQDEPIREVIISPNPFSPNGDGIYDETNITLDLQYDGKVDADIFDLNGNPIRKFLRNAQVYKGRNENLIWDGKDDDGRMQPLGIYLLSVRLSYVFEGNERIFRKNAAIVIVR